MASVSDAPDDYLDDMAECLLLFFNRFQWLEVKSMIEETCGIKTWSGEEIERALDEIEKMKKKQDPRVKQWACVITFQLMEIQDYEEHVRTEAESNLAKSETVKQPSVILKSDESDKPNRSSQSNTVVCPPLSLNSLEDELSEGISSVSLSDSSSRPSQSKAKPIQSSSAKTHDQPQDDSVSTKANNSNRSSQSNANKNNSRSNKKNEQPQGTLPSGRSNNSSQSNLSFSENQVEKRSRSESSSAIGIKIPLSELFDGEAHTEQAVTVASEYKLTDECPLGTKIIKTKSYVSSYNKNIKNAEWVFEILNNQTLARNVEENRDFHKCRIIKNYDRGHLAAAANHRWCKEAYIDTYELINISPQHSVLNRRTWKYLENMCRKKVNDQKNVHVYTGTIILPSRSINLTENRQVVPHYFYKVIIEENNDGTVLEPMCYLVYNDKHKVKHDLENWKMKYRELQNFLKQKYRIHIKNINTNERNENTMSVMNIEHTEETKDIEFIKHIISNFFVKSTPMYTDEIRSMTWTGEGNGRALHSVHIKVRISIPENSNNDNNPTVE